jgi:hypothetical protein
MDVDVADFTAYCGDQVQRSAAWEAVTEGPGAARGCPGSQEDKGHVAAQ